MVVMVPAFREIKKRWSRYAVVGNLQLPVPFGAMSYPSPTVMKPRLARKGAMNPDSFLLHISVCVWRER